jgi:hypothetical protein
MYTTKTLKGTYIADNRTSNVAASSGLESIYYSTTIHKVSVSVELILSHILV